MPIPVARGHAAYGLVLLLTACAGIAVAEDLQIRGLRLEPGESTPHGRCGTPCPWP